jgi:AcrR family transcriptional regulator
LSSTARTTIGESVTPRPDSPQRHTRNPRGAGERLREELIAAADRLLRAGQTHESLSLRAVAREVGIAATSVYLHFPDKLALLLAVFERHFAQLARQIEDAIAEHPDPAGQLRAAATAYWRFAAEHPDAYHVMFTVPGTNTMADPLPADRRPGAAIVLAVQEVIARCVQAGLTPALDPYHAALCLWTSLHGLITMMAARPYVPWPAPQALLDTLLSTYLTPGGN